MGYLDDIIIYSRSEKEHLEHLEEIFRRLKTAGLKLKLEKLDTPTPKCHGIRSLLVVLFLLKLRVVPHGTKGTSPKFVTRPVCASS